MLRASQERLEPEEGEKEGREREREESRREGGREKEEERKRGMRKGERRGLLMAVWKVGAEGSPPIPHRSVCGVCCPLQ